MPFLELKDRVVDATEEGKELSSVQDLYNADKTASKKFYHDALKYIYFVYKADGVYSNMFESSRKNHVILKHFEKREIKDFEANIRVKAVIKDYLDLQLTKTKRLYYRLEKDMEDLLDRISKIPYTRKVKVKVPVEGNDGKTEVATEIEIENYEEKAKAMLMADKLIDYEAKIKAKIFREEVASKKNSTTRLFDRKDR